MTTRLDFGCAFEKHDGWMGFDKVDYGQEYVGDILDGLPFADYQFDMIAAHHSLQMIRFDDLSRALAELRRVLKVGGVIRISVPDADRVMLKFVAGDCEGFPIADDIEPTGDGKLLRYLFWHGDARSAFTFVSLANTLNRNGFQNVQRCQFRQTFSAQPEIVELDGREEESLFVEAVK